MKEETISNIGVIIGVILIIMAFVIEFAMFHIADIEKQCKKNYADKNDYFIKGIDCSNIAKDVWICNARNDSSLTPIRKEE